MRVALITYSTKPRGGVVHTLALAEALAVIGAEVTVWTLGRGGDRAFFRTVDPAVTLEVVPFDPRADESVGERILRSIATMARAFRPEDYDIVHAQDCISANAVPGSIRTVHHLDEFTTPELIACHDRAIEQPIALVCVSAAVAGEVQAGWNRTPTVIPNGVDSARFAHAADTAGEPDRAYWTSRLGDYVLALGGIEPRKGSIDLLEAYALMRSTGAHDDVQLVFGVGKPCSTTARTGTPSMPGPASSGSSRSSWAPSTTPGCPASSPRVGPWVSSPPRRASGWRPWRRWPPGYRWWPETCPCCGRFSVRPCGTPTPLRASPSNSQRCSTARYRILPLAVRWPRRTAG